MGIGHARDHSCSYTLDDAIRLGTLNSTDPREGIDHGAAPDRTYIYL